MSTGEDRVTGPVEWREDAVMRREIATELMRAWDAGYHAGWDAGWDAATREIEADPAEEGDTRDHRQLEREEDVRRQSAPIPQRELTPEELDRLPF